MAQTSKTVKYSEKLFFFNVGYSPIILTHRKQLPYILKLSLSLNIISRFSIPRFIYASMLVGDKKVNKELLHMSLNLIKISQMISPE